MERTVDILFVGKLFYSCPFSVIPGRSGCIQCIRHTAEMAPKNHGLIPKAQGAESKDRVEPETWRIHQKQETHRRLDDPFNIIN